MSLMIEFYFMPIIFLLEKRNLGPWKVYEFFISTALKALYFYMKFI